MPLVETLPLGNVLIVAPRAPLPFNPGGFGGGFAWYEFGQEGIPDPRTFQASVERLRRFLVEIKEAYPVDVKHLVLLGFSQGTVMAYASALQDPEWFRGIAALSGYIPRQSGLPLILHNLNGLSVFISHGTYDDLIPVSLSRESAELLKAAGASVLFREYRMGHEVREETLRDLGAWFKDVFS